MSGSKKKQEFKKKCNFLNLSFLHWFNERATIKALQRKQGTY